MQIGQTCRECGSDHWICIKSGKARCGVCKPSARNYRSEWPRILCVHHNDFKRKNGNKFYFLSVHRFTITDYELSRSVAVHVEKIRGDRGEFFYRVKPIMKHDAKDYVDAKRMFLKLRRPERIATT